MADQIYGPFPDFDDSFLDENDDCNFLDDATSNWYMNDLFDQFFCLQKSPTQSVKSYFDEAKSLLHALESAGVSLSELEFTNFLVEGLDDTLYNRVHVYYHLMHPSFNDLSTLLFGHEKMLQQFTSIDTFKIEPMILEPNDMHSSVVTHLEDTTSSIGSSSLLTDNLILAVPASCTGLKSELLSSFFSVTNGYSHSHFDFFKNSFLICSSSSIPIKEGNIISLRSLDPTLVLYHDELCEVIKEVYGVSSQSDLKFAIFSAPINMFRNVSAAFYISEAWVPLDGASSRILLSTLVVCLHVLLLMSYIFWFHRKICGRWRYGFIFDRGRLFFVHFQTQSASYVEAFGLRGSIEDKIHKMIKYSSNYLFVTL